MWKAGSRAETELKPKSFYLIYVCIWSSVILLLGNSQITLPVKQ